MKRSSDIFFLQTSRIAICCWIAVAAFFVRVGLKPISSPEIDSFAKLHLLLLLFPGYYCAAFSLMGVSFVSGLWLWRSPLVRRRVQIAFLVLLGLSLVLTMIDWWWIYKPLEEMVRVQINEMSAPPANFRDYHIASRNINMVHVSFAGLAMFCAMLNGKRDTVSQREG